MTETRVCTECGQRPAKTGCRRCNHCIHRRAQPLDGRPVCEVADCDCVARCNDRTRCLAHRTSSFTYCCEPGPLPTMCKVVEGHRYVRGGYTTIWLDGRLIRIHRLVWELHYGPIPEGLCVCHACDNPACCNIEHLWLGTRAENNADRDRKGRKVQVRGEASGTAKLTAAQVDEIRRRYAAGGVSQRALGAEYGVGRTTIREVLARRIWAWL